MAINRFAIGTDGFGKPGTVSGKDWANVVPRALLITWGYLNRTLEPIERRGRGSYVRGQIAVRPG